MSKARFSNMFQNSSIKNRLFHSEDKILSRVNGKGYQTVNWYQKMTVLKMKDNRYFGILLLLLKKH